MEFEKNEGSVFLNGKAQIVEMLEFMTPNEKAILLNNIKQRNPTLANELQEQSLSFDDLDKLQDHEIEIIFSYIKAEIIGVALKDVSIDLQRRVLSLAPREYAETAYEVLTRPLQNRKGIIKKAQNKIITLLINLSKRGQIHL